jgi:hypothetical protein
MSFKVIYCVEKRNKHKKKCEIEYFPLFWGAHEKELGHAGKVLIARQVPFK